MYIKFEREHLIDWLNVVNKALIIEGWEFCGFHNRDYNMVRIRKKYEKDEMVMNEDGYKYKSLYPNLMNTKDYLYFRSKGYPLEVSF